MSKQLILIVEDRAEQHCFVQRATKGLDVECVFACTATEALDALEKAKLSNRSYNLVLFDLDLPGPNPVPGNTCRNNIDRGKVLYDQLRSLISCPIVILSAYAELEPGIQAIAAMDPAPDKVVDKYPSIAELREVLLSYLQCSVQERVAV
ncbi:MAG: response regulator [Phycisphaerales bacterium]|nr:response regulator [Phycisphaerales bacterium]